MTPSVVVFDIGGVLVDWEPHLAWASEMGADKARAFLDRIGFDAINRRGDGGERFDDLAAELRDSEDAARLRQYVERYRLTVPNAVPGTWDVLDRLRHRGIPLHAITNWSAETWPEGLKVHPRLDQVFGTVVVSGRERIMKPDRRIFDLLCQRAGVAARDCVFIDDSLRNVEGARSAGMDAIHFTGAPALEDALATRGLL